MITRYIYRESGDHHHHHRLHVSEMLLLLPCCLIFHWICRYDDDDNGFRSVLIINLLWASRDAGASVSRAKAITSSGSSFPRRKKQNKQKSNNFPISQCYLFWVLIWESRYVNSPDYLRVLYTPACIYTCKAKNIVHECCLYLFSSNAR